jgi:SHS2 domain-containing protein
MIEKRWRTFEHPSDLGLEAWGESLPALLEALGDALAAQICLAGRGKPQERVDVSVQADDVAELAVEFLARLLGLAAIGHRVITDVAVDRADATSMHARVGLEKVDLARHELGAEIKAVTYHQLLVEQRAGQWHARVLLDL